ncbi:MAG: FkbM family methyltransferase, partial [Chloroflexi bacterium]|nr:FkbM family methyltransferase [Chloroflexota bacterium]
MENGRLARVHRYLGRRLHEWQRPQARALRQLRHSIGHLPRRQHGIVQVWGWNLEFVDAASCISAFDYIVVRGWNDFTPGTTRPRILDCGANIGISVLHYKRLWPEAEIVAFEADPAICEVLGRNLRRNSASDVEIVQAALWDTEGEVTFQPDGTDAGRVLTGVGGAVGIRVKTQRLADYLEQPVDLVKMDIEGAETRVLADCR